MKKYTITVEIEEVKDSSKGFIDSIIDEVREEKHQLSITHKLNKKSTKLHREIINDVISKKLHREILNDVISDLNSELERIGAKFENVQYHGDSNHYRASKAIVNFSNSWSYILYCGRFLSSKVEGLKHCTYVDKPDLWLERTKYKNYSVSDDIPKGPTVKADEIIKFMEHDIRTHINSLDLV
jgi:hypothetical protein